MNLCNSLALFAKQLLLAEPCRVSLSYILVGSA